MYITLFSPLNNSVKDMSLFPLLEIRKLSCKEINSHIQGHTASEWQSQDLNPGCQAIKSTKSLSSSVSSAWDQSWTYWKERLSLVKRGLKRETGFIYRLEKDQWPHTQTNLVCRGHLVLSGDTFYCHNLELATGIK